MKIRFEPLTYLLLFLFAGSAFTACMEDDGLPDEPVINEIWFDKTTDELNIRFTDGDGDFGLEPNQTNPPFNLYEEDSTINFFYFNLHVDTYYRSEGEWVPVILPDGALGNNWRIPDLTPEGQSKQLRVLVRVDFSNTNEEMLTDEMDTVQYRAVIVDRALNISNEARTEPVIFSD